MSFKLHLLLAVCFLGSALSLDDGRARYDNYRLYKVIASSVAELAVLKDLEGATDSMIFLDGVHMVGKDVQVVVAPHKIPDFLQLMGTNDIEYELVERNLQSLLEGDENEVASSRAAYGWTSYYKLQETYDWLADLAKTYAGVVTLIDGGKTYEGRTILGVKISRGSGKPGIFVESGIHAREWISPATTTYIINQLLTSNVAAVKDLTQSYDWYIFPHTNPDGYVYTHEKDRLWRKTRRPYGSCFGADPNRNWAFHWNEVGASNNACSDTYAGPSAFSEIETKGLSNYLTTLKGKIHLYLSFHAYSQYLLYPYGYTGSLPSNVNDLKSVFNVATAAISKQFGTKYTGGNVYDAIYPAAGSSTDWAYGTLGTKMAFCYELRPAASNSAVGFKLPATSIIATASETVDSVVAMVGEVKRLGYFK